MLYAAPPLVLFLASHPGVLPKYLQSLRHVVCGAAPLGGLDAERFLKRTPPSTDVFQGSMGSFCYLTNIVFTSCQRAYPNSVAHREAHKHGGKTDRPEVTKDICEIK